MTKIKYEIFFGNSSTEEAAKLFVLGKLSFKQFGESCWPRECKNAIKELKRRGYIKAIRSMQRALSSRGFCYSDYKEIC